MNEYDVEEIVLSKKRQYIKTFDTLKNALSLNSVQIIVIDDINFNILRNFGYGSITLENGCTIGATKFIERKQSIVDMIEAIDILIKL